MEFIIKMVMHLKPDLSTVIDNITKLNAGEQLSYDVNTYSIEAHAVLPPPDVK